ncbi:MAG: mannan-binding lectin [Desulfobacterales bacterium]|nr:mannan-binding lectin [Desulfobacterales bacterium]
MKVKSNVKSGYDIPAGPIWNNGDAQGKCPKTCAPFGGWNGNWLTTIPGRMSVCGCNVNPNIVGCKPGPGAILS